MLKTYHFYLKTYCCIPFLHYPLNHNKNTLKFCIVKVSPFLLINILLVHFGLLLGFEIAQGFSAIEEYSN